MADFISITRHADGSASWPCGTCGDVVTRYRGQSAAECQCGVQYDAFGQRLRDDSANYDAEIIAVECFDMEDEGEDWDDEDWDG